MNDLVRAVILGIVEGLTEFLPISSTGHLVLVEPLLGIPPGDPFWAGTFDIFIQSGAILAVVIYFGRRLWNLMLPDTSIRWWEHLLVKLLVAFVPAAAVGLLCDDLIQQHLMRPPVVAAALVVGGLLILLIEARRRTPRFTDAGRIPLTVALGIGVAQIASLVPGTSRSAATIMGALLLGLSPPAAAEFSFFLSIPTIFAAGGYKLLKNLENIHPDQFLTLGVGFAVSFVVAWVVIAAFMRYIQTHRFTVFAVYRIVLGIVVLTAASRLHG